MSIVIREFAKVKISQAFENITLKDGRIIPKGYVNATEMCKANGKLWSNYIKNEKAKSFTTKVSSSLLNGRDSVITIEGAFAEYYGTWIHIDVAMHLSYWLSDDFALWASKTLVLVINGDFKALTKEAEEAQKQLQTQWQKIRNAGKETRRKLTDAIRDWYIRNPNGTSRPQHAMYAQTTDAIYLKLWGVKAVQLESHLKCGRHESRDYLDKESLKLLDRAEGNVMDYIDEDNIKPIDAVNLANIRPAKQKPFRTEN